MPTDWLAEYNHCCTRLHDLTQEMVGLIDRLRRILHCLEKGNWQHVVIGDVFSGDVLTDSTGDRITAEEWPSLEQAAKILAEWYVLKGRLMDARGQVDQKDRPSLRPPPFQM